MSRRHFYSALALSGLLLCPILILVLRPDPPDEKAVQGHALDAFENWYNQRAAPYDKIPLGAYMRAAEYARTQMVNERELRDGLADTTQWLSIGPDNVGGRVLAVTVHPTSPNILWAGAASGGLWKSTTAGVGASAWTYVNTGNPTVAVSSIAINPADPNIMYIGTGEVGSAYGRGQVGTPGARSTYGMGVLKSVDGGNTWTVTGLVFTFPQITAVQKVLINPLNANTLYAITTEGTYKSLNAGSSWTLVHSVLMGMDIVINPVDTATLYAAYGQRNSTVGKGVYRTTNAGSTWTRLTGLDTTNFGRTSLAISPSNPLIVYASVAHGVTSQLRGLYRTTNGGTPGSSWSLQSTTNYVSSQGWYDNVIAVHPTGPDTVYGAGLDIYKSTNGGVTLTQRAYWYLGYDQVVPAGGPEGPPNYAHADHHAIAFHPTNPRIMYFGTDGGIFASSDGGETFEGRNGGFVTTQFYNGVASSETNPSIALGGLQDNGTLKYEGSLSWNKTYGGDGGWCAIDPTNENILYEEYVYLAMSKSTNGGANWFGITSGLATGSSNANFIAPFVLAPSSPNILYAGALVVYKTANGGSSWSPTNGGVAFNGTPVACIGVSYNSPDTLIAGTGSGATSPAFQIFASSNGGTSWTNVTGSNPNRYPTDISFDPTSGRVAYLTYSGYGTPHVFKTTNAGQTWADISSNLPDIPVQSVTVDPLFPTHIYVGTDLSVYRTTNGGGSWVVFDNGMPPAMVLDIGVSSANRSLRASTFGNGVYERELPAPSIFDYRALAFVTPDNGAQVLAGSSIAPITARFRNVGALTPPDSFDVRYQILSGTTEVYSSTTRIASLSYGETRDVTFSGAFTPPDTGTYTLHAIALVNDQNELNDTLRGSLVAVNPGTIAFLNAIKIHRPYAEISGGTAGPAGDDVQSVAALPFLFEFDGFTYDSIQISTNGWAELGTGARGSERGLSTASQIGLGNQNGSLFTPGRPTKVLGAWWEDLNTHTAGDPTASVTYKTMGTSPNRTFAIQWKQMLAYYDPGTTTTRINFQVLLQEGSHSIEYGYGPVQAGTLAGSDLGAMTGMKDHLGGNYHFYDLALGGTGTVSQGITDLSPLTDWPGPDSSYIIGGSVVSVNVAIDERWNLVSVPVDRQDNSVSSVFPTAVPGTTFRFTNSYQATDTLTPGEGYWTKFPSATTQTVSGTSMSSLVVPVTAGWNIIGSVDHDVTPPSGGVIASVFFGYSAATGYITATSLSPGRGYWVKASANGTISLGPQPSRDEVPGNAGEFSSVTITDRLNRSQGLFVVEASSITIGLEYFEMPPRPPEGSFDARFASQRMFEGYPSDLHEGEGVSFEIEVRGAEYPLQLVSGIQEGSSIKLIIEETEGGAVVATHLLNDGVPIRIGRIENNSLVLRVVQSTPLPKDYALLQNYPNPFNPSTRISYALPRDGKLTLVIYDLLGREVTTLVNAEQPAGFHTVQWDGRNAAGVNVSSGIYLCRFKAGAFSDVKKMIYMK